MGAGAVSARWLVAKRALDIFGAAVLLVLTSPVLLLIAIAIKLRYPGVPVVFGQWVVGKGGVPFRMWKFSTMIPDAHLVLDQLMENDEALSREWKANFKLKDDPRVLPGVGTLLRRTSLNELPQLFNVLAGEMALVGPRPVLQRELVQYYGPVAQLYKQVRPGITGLWQVSGRSNTTYGERVAYDEQYIRTWSLWRDIVILFRTVKVVCSGEGAY